MEGKLRFRRVAAWMAVVLWMAVIFSFSAQTRAQSAGESGHLIESAARLLFPQFEQLPAERQKSVVESWQFVVRKAAHMTEFAILGALLLAAFWQYPLRKRARAAAALGAGILYAAVDEWHQLFVPGRGSQWQDVAVDTLGVLAGIGAAMALLWIVRKIRHKKDGKPAGA